MPVSLEAIGTRGAESYGVDMEYLLSRLHGSSCMMIMCEERWRCFMY